MEKTYKNTTYYKPKKVALTTLFILSFTFFYTAKAFAVPPADVGSPYSYNFNQGGVLHEVNLPDNSTSPYWWVSSGGNLNIYEGRGRTIKGELQDDDPWRLIYAISNPRDTDNGYHPQNIFRLITRSIWQDAREEANFVITKNNLSESPYRNQSNGLLLMNRYIDENNLYYTGIRVDGAAIIKKKQNGRYYTLAYIKGVYPGLYDRDTNPNLLPLNKWIGIRTEITNEGNNAVRIKVFIDKLWSGNWQLIAEAVDDGRTYGPAIRTGGFGGIRTDFMDVDFENFRFRNL
ncbi:MAG: hypothetical protein COU07_00110 [Candidatus Harrisonbacteria bacterium CG10_big_fil_rev_8_21_14_0_10_40_38]|uniref:3-keto-disaccharide hydrolase domain-containing protein n=1 Tax=Candidatus Harrisonbacteria bacterium CG10_big_fil_rev_8_21_14_0_10_40_38 TaxID=1974583 RepID=A0A2H0USA7_9BACT|nr:MAG: hypothetical protein COU07_00110 [Candidatus Harrisonbacteria bacterium CG10_big_fil_rev_8_21_14_0_10_40_38]